MIPLKIEIFVFASMHVEYLLKIKQHGEEWYKLSGATETADHAMFIFPTIRFL